MSDSIELADHHAARLGWASRQCIGIVVLAGDGGNAACGGKTENDFIAWIDGRIGDRSGRGAQSESCCSAALGRGLPKGQRGKAEHNQCNALHLIDGVGNRHTETLGSAIGCAIVERDPVARRDRCSTQADAAAGSSHVARSRSCRACADHGSGRHYHRKGCSRAEQVGSHAARNLRNGYRCGR